MEQALLAVDELSGFIRAVTPVRPNKSLNEVNAGPAVRKMEDQTFAKDVNRDDIYQVTQVPGVGPGGHTTCINEALKPVFERIGLNTETPEEARWDPIGPTSSSLPGLWSL